MPNRAVFQDWFYCTVPMCPISDEDVAVQDPQNADGEHVAQQPKVKVVIMADDALEDPEVADDEDAVVEEVVCTQLKIAMLGIFVLFQVIFLSSYL